MSIVLKIVLVTSFLLPMIVVPTWSEEGPKLFPVDEAVQDTTFFLFRNHLLKVVRARDMGSLLETVDDDIIVAHDGPQGVETFKAICNLQDTESKYWKEIEIILMNGGIFKESRDGCKYFMASYVHGKWHDTIVKMIHSSKYKWPDDVDLRMEIGVIVGEKVELRESPQNDSNVIRVLEYDVVGAPDNVRINNEPPPKKYPGWIRVVTHDGCYGFIPTEYYRDWYSYLMVFGRINGQWKIVRFVKGTA